MVCGRRFHWRERLFKLVQYNGNHKYSFINLNEDDYQFSPQSWIRYEENKLYEKRSVERVLKIYTDMLDNILAP